MDFSFSEEQEAVRDLAKQILEGTINPERLKEMKANGEHLDRKAWQELANAGLIGIALALLSYVVIPARRREA